MVKKLYGITHGGGIDVGGIPLSEIGGLFGCPEAGRIHIYPSFELISELAALSEKSRVGLEVIPELVVDNIIKKGIEVDGIEYDFSGESMVYWQRLVDACILNNLDPVFLDSAEHMKQNTRKRIEASELEEKANSLVEENIVDGELPSEIEEQVLQLVRESYRLEQEAWYVHSIQREEAMLEKIAKTKPEVVVLGEGHTDFFIKFPETGERNGVRFEEYAKEDFTKGLDPYTLLAYSSGELEHIPLGLIQNAIPDESVLAQRDQIIRKHNAASEGRIIMNGRPTFVGTWDSQIPAKGLFEMYVEKDTEEEPGVRSISGTMEDVIGTAFFDGAITHDAISFTKEYERASVDAGAFPRPMYYVAKLEDGVYSGKINTGHVFEMSEF